MCPKFLRTVRTARQDDWETPNGLLPKVNCTFFISQKNTASGHQAFLHNFPSNSYQIHTWKLCFEQIAVITAFHRWLPLAYKLKPKQVLHTNMTKGSKTESSPTEAQYSSAHQTQALACCTLAMPLDKRASQLPAAQHTLAHSSPNPQGPHSTSALQSSARYRPRPWR